MLAIELTVNGKYYQVTVPANISLLDLLRDQLGLNGVKDACGQEGECGACSVLMDGKLVNSCMVLAGQVDGREVVTIEGLQHQGSLHPVQQAFVESGAVQCGFCTPGVILSVYDLLRRIPHPDDNQIREALSGNLCRCTGYTKMLDAVHRAEKELSHVR